MATKENPLMTAAVLKLSAFFAQTFKNTLMKSLIFCSENKVFENLNCGPKFNVYLKIRIFKTSNF